MSRFGLLMLVAKAALVLSQLLSAASGEECKTSDATKAKIAAAIVKARQNAQPALPDSLPDKTGIVPIPLPPADTKDRDAGSQEAKIQPADSRPVVYFHMVHGYVNGEPLCPPCEALGDWWLENCDTAPFRFVPVEYASFDDLPAWVARTGVPCVQYQSAQSPTGWKNRPWMGLTEFVKCWREQNPKRIGELKGVKRA